ncbi:hypothetical protein VTK73DRAFT_8107 [Phialemonium thermophilum]|uniref:Uncharacterized protein n=1 Tax=Phialemonium thermophilum TaxID=223376 RepID=A0ABR3WA75_9PEZI
MSCRPPFPLPPVWDTSYVPGSEWTASSANQPRSIVPANAKENPSCADDVSRTEAAIRALARGSVDLRYCDVARRLSSVLVLQGGDGRNSGNPTPSSLLPPPSLLEDLLLYVLLSEDFIVFVRTRRRIAQERLCCLHDELRQSWWSAAGIVSARRWWAMVTQGTVDRRRTGIPSYAVVVGLVRHALTEQASTDNKTTQAATHVKDSQGHVFNSLIDDSIDDSYAKFIVGIVTKLREAAPWVAARWLVSGEAGVTPKLEMQVWILYHALLLLHLREMRRFRRKEMTLFERAFTRLRRETDVFV